MANTLRIDLTDYRPYVEVLVEALNKDALCPMSMTDAVKIAIERSMEKLVSDVKINKTRKKYIRLNY